MKRAFSFDGNDYVDAIFIPTDNPKPIKLKSIENLKIRRMHYALYAVGFTVRNRKGGFHFLLGCHGKLTIGNTITYEGLFNKVESYHNNAKSITLTDFEMTGIPEWYKKPIKPTKVNVSNKSNETGNTEIKDKKTRRKITF